MTEFVAQIQEQRQEQGDWTVYDKLSGTIAATFDHEPTPQELERVKNKLNYSSVKAKKFSASRRIELTPFDTSG